MMTIEEMFTQDKITKDHVTLIAEQSEYWAKASKFILDNWDTAWAELSVKQALWAGNIFDDMVEMRIQRKGVFR